MRVIDAGWFPPLTFQKEGQKGRKEKYRENNNDNLIINKA